MNNEIVKPQRIQRKRLAGWKMPENTVSVTRPGKWGNPFIGEGAAELFKRALMDLNAFPMTTPQRLHMRRIRDTYRDLAGKNLACWCAPGTQCHADALLELLQT